MRDAGVEPIVPMEEVSVVGGWEVLTRLGAVLRARSALLGALRDPPDIVIPVDYPGFNLRFAHRAKSQGIPVLYYIGPQIWAWWKGRLAKMARAVDHAAVVFPFEVPLYRGAGIPVTYVGHPLAEDLQVELDESGLRRQAGLPERDPYVAILPGSRPHEVRRILPPMLDAVRILRQRRPDLTAILAAASDELALEAERLGAGGESGVRIVTGQTPAVTAHARGALVASGTATLESAILGTPLVIAYRLAPLTWFLAKRLVKVQWVGLANIVAGEEVAPELLQGKATGEAMAAALEPLLEEGELRQRTLERLSGVRGKLGTPDAAGRVAGLALELIRSRSSQARTS
jgi:lipid-A-disaccharide synthase